MEFMYRAGDPSPAPTAPAAPAGGPPAVGADDTRRQAEKARIRERILREETVDRFDLELEVRRDLVEQFRQMSAPRAGGPEPPPPARVTEACTSPPVAPPKICNDNAVEASMAKRKSRFLSPAVNAANKKQKLISLTCKLCCMTANSEKAMQDHLNGKGHKRKAVALATQPTSAQEPEPEAEEADEEDAVFTAPSGYLKPTKFTMVTNKGALNPVTQMDGYLLCEVCNARAADRVTMMCHLEGSKHISKAKASRRATGEASSLPTKRVNAAPMAAAAPVAGGVSDTVVLEVEGERHTVRREGGVLLCELCSVKSPSESGMRLHLSGKKHKSNANASSVASVIKGTNDAGKDEAANAQAPTDEGTGIVDPTASQMEAPPVPKPVEENASDRSSEVQDTKATKEAPGTETAKVTSGPLAVVVHTDAGSELDMKVDGVRHPLRRVEGYLLCLCCDVKAPSDIVMRSHLIGKKHKNKMKLAEAGVGGKGASVAATLGEEQSNAPKMSLADEEAGSEARTAINAAAAPTELDAAAEVTSLTTPTEPTNDTTEPAGKPFKIQLEGKLFTVLEEKDDRFACQPCGVRG